MVIDERYMQRCLQLAENGKGFVSPNPMVGAVIVHNDRIIGEGFHREYGKAHAEVNAIKSVSNKSLLQDSTIYVSLEPCSHHGKTPPCSQLIIDSQIPRVVIATLDPYHQVSGRGVNMLREAGAEVIVGIMEEEAKKLNKTFFTNQILKRPYIYLKWAQTKDGFIDILRTSNDKPQPTVISNNFTRILVHKLRAECTAILIGTNTAVNDNPSLSTRYWYGKSPTRVILDRSGRIPANYNIFDNSTNTIIFTETINTITQNNKTKLIPLKFDENVITNILSELHVSKIDSVLVEGGSHVLQSFIDKGIWDEAYIEISNTKFETGLPAPKINGEILSENISKTYKQVHLSNSINKT